MENDSKNEEKKEKIGFFKRFFMKFKKPPVGLIPLPTDATGNYMEIVNKFIDDIFYSVLYDFVFNPPIGFSYEPFYSEFIIRFSDIAILEDEKQKLREWQGIFYKRVLAECLTKASFYIRANFERVYSPISLSVDDEKDSGFIDYILKYSDRKINYLSYELTIWRRNKDLEYGQEHLDVSYWGHSSREDYAANYFRQLRMDSNLEILMPRISRICDPYRESIFKKAETHINTVENK